MGTGGLTMLDHAVYVVTLSAEEVLMSGSSRTE